MPTLEEALNGSVVQGYSDGRALNERLIIDAESRGIYIPESEHLLGVESDEKGERKYFEMPRYVGNNLDIWELGLRVVYSNAQGQNGMYIVEDKTLEGDKVVFSWELYRSVTEYKGNVEFLVCAVKAQADGTYTNEWNTTTAIGKVLKGLEKPSGEGINTVTEDLIEQLLYIVNNSISNVEQATEEQKQLVYEQIEQKAADTLKTIPEEYTEIDRQVKVNTEDISVLDRSTVILQTVKGELPLIAKGSSARKPEGLILFGKGWQDKVTGNQLFNFDTSIQTNGYKENVGVTATLTDDKNIIINGTSTAEIWLTLGTAILTAGETYTLSCASSLAIAIWDSTASGQSAGKTIGSAKTTFTPNNTGKHVIVIANPSGTTFNNVLANIMVVKGSTAMDWEPYVGGKASPNLEYSQKVHKLGESKQLFEKINSEGLGATVSEDKLTVTCNPKTGSTYVDLFSIYHPKITLAAGVNYYVSFDLKLTSGSISRINTVSLLDSNGSVIGSTKILTNPAVGSNYNRYVFSITPSTAKEAIRLYIQGYNSNAATISVTNIMVSTESTKWEPYGGSIEYGVLGGNLANQTKARVLGITTSAWLNNAMNISYSVHDYGRLIEVPFKGKKGKTYYYSFRIFKNSTNAMVRTYFPEIGQYFGITKTTGVASGKVTLNDDVSKIGVYIADTDWNENVEILIDNFIFSEIDIPYEPYKEKQSLILQTPNGLGGLPVSSGGNWTDANGQQYIADYSDLERGKRVQRILETVFDGSSDEGWQIDGANRFYTNLLNGKIVLPLDANTTCYALSTHFIPRTGNQTYQGTTGISMGADGSIRIYTGDTNLDTWKSKLAENPVTCYFVLLEPIETDLTEEEIAQYKALMMNYPNTTLLCDEVGATAEWSYSVDPKIYIQDNCPSRAEFEELKAVVEGLKN